MSDAAQAGSEDAHGADSGGAMPLVAFQRPQVKPDLATILGLVFVIALIAAAIAMGKSNANFFNLPSVLIVIFGTMAGTAISFTGEELARAGKILKNSAFRRIQRPSVLAKSLIDLAVVAKKKGILAIAGFEDELKKDAFLERAIQMVIDGYNADEVSRLLGQEIETQIERHKRSANILRRASELAPAMGLIGTLVGLVQMLADLENPETIGPAMAVALLTTFYGAILGTVIMAPLAVKLEKNSSDETLVKTLIITAATSIARHENPRRLEMLLNAELPPSERIIYFD
jgi:chemotaxis protein MotA